MGRGFGFKLTCIKYACRSCGSILSMRAPADVPPPPTRPIPWFPGPLQSIIFRFGLPEPPIPPPPPGTKAFHLFLSNFPLPETPLVCLVSDFPNLPPDRRSFIPIPNERPLRPLPPPPADALYWPEFLPWPTFGQDFGTHERPQATLGRHFLSF